MNSEAVKKLSIMIRDKDLEISSLSERNKSLMEIIENEKQGPEAGETIFKQKCQDLEEEVKKLKEENMKLADESNTSNEAPAPAKDKESVENSNELIYLKGRIAELERRLNLVGGSSGQRRRYLSEDLHTGDQDAQEEADAELDTSRQSDESRLVYRKLETKEMQVESLQQQVASLAGELAEERETIRVTAEQLLNAKEQLQQSQLHLQERDQDVERTKRSLLSMQALLDEKRSSNETQQAEVVRHIAEQRRLEEELGRMGSERDSALATANARTEEAADLRREVAGIIEKKRRVEGEVERLRGHLVAVEEGYTGDLLQGEEREKDLRKRVAQLEDQARMFRVQKTEATQEASEATVQLKMALESAAQKRDQLSDQLAGTQATLREKNSALRNLQLALESFQRQKSNELARLEKICNERVLAEQRTVQKAEEQLRATRTQLDRANVGLEAAARLSEQLDKKSTTIAHLKQEIAAREDLLRSAQQKIESFSSSSVGKVDRSLVKNLVVGYVTADAARRPEILRIVATVLDFNQVLLFNHLTR